LQRFICDNVATLVIFLTILFESAKKNIRFQNSCFKLKQRESICDDVEPRFSHREEGFCFEINYLKDRKWIL
jgi:hypothetical protein